MLSVHTQPLACMRAIGSILKGSIRIATTKCPLVIRSMKLNASRWALPNVPSTELASKLRTVGKRQYITVLGTAYAIVDGNPLPVCDYVGFAPFGFGYRRCPAEQLTIKVFEDFLRKVWNSKIELKKLDIANPELLPIGPTTVAGDDVGFIRAT
jgi:hypothetical protein